SQSAIITEVKYASPSLGRIREDGSPVEIARAMVKGGACALSVLTASDGFNGKLENLRLVADEFPVPILMKDIIVSPRQLKAGSDQGADAVVLISELFTRDLAEVGLDVMIEESSKLGLETLVETNSSTEFASFSNHGIDLYGINNRDLSTFQVELSRTEEILSKNVHPDRLVVSESGIETGKDVRRLRRAGARAFLVGASVMRAANIEEKVRELVGA
ncbi:MAG TPA: indole-3-glycerol-phosphate synthase, partial [Candidatus Bathyarchaeia archaeon]|nr:indole-3-glycerol-phosphate synthase [Candidatus Bathyarchaeia archaeon]